MAFTISAAVGLSVVAWRGRLALLRQPRLAWAHGVGGLAGYHALYFAAFGFAPAAEANLINYSWPLLIVLLAAPVLGLRLTWRHGAGTLLGAAGCAVLLGTATSAGDVPPGNVWIGYLLAFAAAITWALYSVTSRRLASVPTEAVAGFCAASAVLAMLAHLVLEHTVMPRGGEWLAIVAMGTGPVGAAFFLWDIGMKRGDPRLLGTLAYATPVLSTLLLCLGGAAPWSLSLAAAACLVATGGILAAAAKPKDAVVGPGDRAAATTRR